MLEGTIQRVGERVRITARLVDVHSAKLVWSESYEHPVAEARSERPRRSPLRLALIWPIAGGYCRQSLDSFFLHALRRISSMIRKLISCQS